MTPHTFALIPASYVYLRRGDEVLLQLRQNTGYMDGYWVAGAAGHVEPGETARDCAVRETEEEIGVTINPDDLTLVSVMQRIDGSDNPRKQRIDWFWTVSEWSGTPQLMEPDKASALAWHRLDSLPSPIPDYEALILRGLLENDLRLDTSVGFDKVSR
ncbi:MAG: NUDIX hydrolase [Propionibacteriaceae bacterium]